MFLTEPHSGKTYKVSGTKVFFI